VTYQTQFKSGEVKWLTEKDLIDKEPDGYVISEPLLEYWGKREAATVVRTVPGAGITVR